MKPTSASARTPAPSCSRARALVALLVGLAVALVAAPAGAADGLARVKKAGVLRWGGDVQGGEPFVHEDAKGHRVGFEVELAEGLARRLGARAEFVQNDWSALIPSLERGTFDVILNGFELTRSRASRVLYTRPYKMFASRLTVRAARPLEGTRAAMKGKRIGSLAGTRSFEIVREARGEPVSYEGCLEPYIDLEQGRIDGVLLDDLIADRYARGRQGLVVAGDVETGAYAIATRRDEATLRDAVDSALAEMIRDGELRAILSRAKLLDARDEVIFTWTADDQARALTGVFPRPAPAAGGGDAGDAGAGDAGPDAGPSAASAPPPPEPPPEAPATFDLPRLALFLKAAGVTLALSLGGMLLASPLGLLLACARTYGGRVLGGVAATYVEVLRGTPLLLQLYLLYFGLAPWLKLPAAAAALLALGLNYAAYEAEAYRAGIQAVPEGHTEAGLALGLSRPRVVWSVVLPQATRLALPNVTSDFVSLLKDSSLVSVITVVELTKQMSITAVDVREWARPGLACALLYLAMSYPLARLARRFEKRRHRRAAQEAE